MVCQAVTPGYTGRCNIKQTDRHMLLHDTTHEEGENAAAETAETHTVNKLLSINSTTTVTSVHCRSTVRVCLLGLVSLYYNHNSLTSGKQL